MKTIAKSILVIASSLYITAIVMLPILYMAGVVCLGGYLMPVIGEGPAILLVAFLYIAMIVFFISLPFM